MILNLEELSKKVSGDEIVILGICRDVEGELAKDIERLSIAFGDFSRVHFRILESDSSDNTIKVLESLQSRISNFKFRSLGNLESSIENRWERIAYCRNACLQVLADDPNLRLIKYFAVADLDGVNTLINRSAVLSCWVREDWDVCTANQAAAYYDVFALRHSTWSPNDCWKFEASLKQNGTHPVIAVENAIYQRQRVIAPHSEWIEVESAFGGLAIYKAGVLNGAKYQGKLSDNSVICEHVPFHAYMKSHGARIYINPRLINCAWNAHNVQHLPINRFKRAVKRGIIKLGLGFALK